MRGVRGVLIVLLGLTLLVSGALAGQAHAQLIGSSPADGATVRTPLTRVDLTYSEDIQPLNPQVIVTDSAGRVSLGDPVVDKATVTVALPDTLHAGRVDVRYRVISADGHPISGLVSFQYAAPQASTGTDDPRSGSGSTTSTPTVTSATPSSTGSVGSAASAGAGTSGARTAAVQATSDGSGGGTTSGPATGLYVGAGALSLVLVGAGAWMLRRTRT